VNRRPYWAFCPITNPFSVCHSGSS
jgi:hypothetical protein